MNHGSLFSGIGGFDLASEWMGWNNIFHCEWNEFGQKVLKYYWPQAISYEDITKTDFSIHRGKIDILTGGFPCQPYSSAGKRLGKEDDRHLWPEMLRAIREIQPTWVVGENVRGLTNWNGGLVFDEVQANLGTEGYEVTPFLLPACAVNAPHRRDRIWFVAYSKNSRFSEVRTTSNARSNVNTPQRESTETERTGSKGIEREKEWGEWSQRANGLSGLQRTNPHTNSRRQQRQGRPERQSYTEEKRDWKKYRVVDDGRWPTQSPICSGNDGFSNRLDGITFPKWRQESIKAYGNAIVPQVAYQIFKAIDQYNG